MRKLIGFVGLAALAACETPYQGMGLTGGVTAQRLDDTTVTIIARGNAYTSPDTIRNYVLRKASEETIADGFEVFTITSSADRSRAGSIYVPGSTTSYTNASVNGYGNSAYGHATTTSYSTPATSMSFIKPGQSVMIQMSKGPCPPQHVDGVFCAATVLKYMTPPAKP